MSTDDGRTEVGLTRDVGWEVGVSRTLPQPPEEVWDVLTSEEGTRLWLGTGARLGRERGAAYRTADGTAGETRSYRPLDRLRLTWQPPGWDHDTTVQVVVSPACGGRTKVTFHQERLADADERASQRDHWRGVVDALAAALEERSG